jgi:hypothetical protein
MGSSTVRFGERFILERLPRKNKLQNLFIAPVHFCMKATETDKVLVGASLLAKAVYQSQLR